jgi:hypothetical protein
MIYNWGKIIYVFPINLTGIHLTPPNKIIKNKVAT